MTTEMSPGDFGDLLSRLRELDAQAAINLLRRRPMREHMTNVLHGFTRDLKPGQHPLGDNSEWALAFRWVANELNHELCNDVPDIADVIRLLFELRALSAFGLAMLADPTKVATPIETAPSPETEKNSQETEKKGLIETL